MHCKMTSDIPTQPDLNQRRRLLRTNRQLKMLLSVWRTLTISGLLSCAVWATTRPEWVLRQSNQIVIEGNNLLSQQAIQSHIKIDYPQSLLQIEPSVIAHGLESYAPIADAKVERKLFPPSVIVQVQERVPVAVAIAKYPQRSSTPTPKTSMGFLDQIGVWIPLESYNSTVRRHFLASLNLKVVGLPNQYRPYWTQLYQTVSRSPVKVQEINCQDAANLILKTEIGVVHFGPYTPGLAKQLQVLDQMRQLSKEIPLSQVAYIDLKNPENPLVQMNQNKKP